MIPSALAIQSVDRNQRIIESMRVFSGRTGEADSVVTHNVEVSGLRGFSRRSARLPGWAVGSPSNLALLIQYGDSCALHGNWLPPYEDRSHDLGNVRLTLTEHVLYYLFEGAE